MKTSVFVKSIFALMILFCGSFANGQTHMSRTQRSAETLINYQDGKKNYDMRFVNDKLTDLSVNGKKIAPEDFPKYEEEISKIRLQTKRDQEKAEVDRGRAEKERERAEKEMDEAESIRTDAELMVQKALAEADAARETAREGREIAKAHELDRQELKEEMERAHENRRLAMRDAQRAMVDVKEARREAARAKREAVRATADAKLAEEDRRTIMKLIDDLVADKVIPDAKSLTSLVLNKKALLVNGEKQSPELQKKYSAEYLRRGEHEITYLNSGGTRQYSVQDDEK